MAARWPSSLVLAGAGKMGGAMLRGWLAGGLSPEAVRILDPHLSEAARAGWRAHGITDGPPQIPPEVLVLAVKPQGLAEAAPGLAAFTGKETLVVSILAGKTLASLRAALPDAGAIVRAMPNLPAAIGRGATGAAGEARVSSAQRATATTLLEAVGVVEWLDESLIDAVTAVSGSGPAYVFHLTERLAEAGVAAGLPSDVATRLARATVEGAAALMAAEPDRAPAALREAVTSPGGTTAAALEVLADLGPLMRQAVLAAKRRAGELAD